MPRRDGNVQQPADRGDEHEDDDDAESCGHAGVDARGGFDTVAVK